ncbi:MAG: acyl-CoA dehydratase activase [Kiritimatiellia bacterium]
MTVAGVDAGSRAIKIVLYDAEHRQVLARGTCEQGVKQEFLAAALLDALLAEHGLSRRQLHRIVATGYGRAALSFADETVTEITCHARGVREVAPEAGTVIDIGGQDSKAIWLDSRGAVRDFVMNDRCAAGTGRFLEVLAGRLGIGVKELGKQAAASAAPLPISSTCVVFAETEIVGLLASNGDPRDIAAGVLKAVASRIASMVGGRAAAPVVLTGGVARVEGMADKLSEAIGCPIRIAGEPEYTGALGAALLAAGGRGR